ncbi:unnamed protein product [Natator depressus]
MQPVTVYVSVLTLATIAVDPYIVIVHPLQRHISLHLGAYVVLFIWIFCCCLALPAMAYNYYVELGKQELTLCKEFWGEQEHQQQTYVLFLLLIIYLCTLLAILVSYTKISLHHSESGQLGQSQAQEDLLPAGYGGGGLRVVLAALAHLQPHPGHQHQCH